MNQSPHLDRYEVVIVILIVTVLVGGFISYSFLRVEETEEYSRSTQRPVAAQDNKVAQEVEDTMVENPGEQVPQTNPFDNTNPFANVYENPFE